ncbi:hypothetical protein [Lutibacter sp.]
MKIISKLLYLNFFLLLFISCDKNEDLSFNDVAGIYEGTLSTNVSGKFDTKSVTETTNPATVEITMNGNEIQVHCYNENFDTTLTLDLFRDNEDIKVCLTGGDFEEMYGHMEGNREMNEGMMGSANEWMQHLSDEHKQGDEHFGGFDMGQNAFEYTFKVNGMDYYFEGYKQ